MKMLTLLLLGMTLIHGDLPDKMRHILEKEAQSEPLALPPKRERKYVTLKPKFKIKEAKAKKVTYSEQLIYDRREVDIPRGLEFKETFNGNFAVHDLFKFTGEFDFSEKFLGNRKNKDDQLSNTLKYGLGFNWKVPASAVTFEGLVENKVKNSLELRNLRPTKIQQAKANFEKVQFQFKVKY